MSELSPELPTVLISGANRGIGRELVLQYANAGWQVLALIRNRKRMSELNSFHKLVVPILLDVSRSGEVETVASKLSSFKIDLIINNAGLNKKEKSIEDIDEKSWFEIMAVNAFTPIKLSHAFLPSLSLSTEPKVVAISSDLGSMHLNRGGGPWMYRSSKAALNAAVKTLARELKEKGVSCAVLHPGWVRTDMGGDEAPLRVEESVEGMRRVIEKLTLSNTGSFWDHKGNEVPW